VSIEINIDYAADDSCQIRLWARGHHEQMDFLEACERELLEGRSREVSLLGKTIRHEHWRTVPADRETRECGVCDTLHVVSRPGRGAYAVTVLDEWLPLHA